MYKQIKEVIAHYCIDRNISLGEKARSALAIRLMSEIENYRKARKEHAEKLARGIKYERRGHPSDIAVCQFVSNVEQQFFEFTGEWLGRNCPTGSHEEKINVVLLVLLREAGILVGHSDRFVSARHPITEIDDGISGHVRALRIIRGELEKLQTGRKPGRPKRKTSHVPTK